MTAVQLSRSEGGIVRIVLEQGEGKAHHVGMGILLTPTRFLTCAHVINVALGRDKIDESHPKEGAIVAVSFPILEDTLHIKARLLDWSPPGQAGLDCVVMELLEPAPSEAGVSILSIVPNDDLLDDTLSIYGSMGQGHPGAHVTAVLQGDVGAQWSQITVNGPSGVQPGFSGGAVWGRGQRATVGMIVALQQGTSGATGYFLSARRIAERFAVYFPTEHRKIALVRQKSFTFVALILFILTLAHFLASRGSSASILAPWADGSKLLAAFFGVHCFAIILGPYVMWHAQRHARSFALRKWWMRVPAFSFGNRADMLDNTPLGAVAITLFLLFLPVAGQISMVREAFFEDHQVYGNVARLNEQNTPEIIACNPDDPKWCRHENVGTWTFLPKPPYFDHAYQYGERCQPNLDCKMVTFFPTLQPIILMSATAVAISWFLMFIYALCRPWPYLSGQNSSCSKEP